MIDDRGQVDEIIRRLEEAGATLLALSVRGIRPASFGSSWPEIVREPIEAYGWTDAEVRPRVPRPDAIDRMDQAFRWLALIPDDRYVLRRVVGARSLVHPVTGRAIYSWRRLGRVLGCDHRAVQTWHSTGISIIAGELARRGIKIMEAA